MNIKKLKTIGIIGGMGPQATLDFVDKIHQISKVLIPQSVNAGYPPLFVYYYRHHPMILNKDGSIPDNLKPDPRLLETAKKVGDYCDFLVIPSNTPHIFQKDIEDASGCKMLSIVDVTIREIKNCNLKKVGVIALGVTSKEGLYQKPLNNLGIECVEIPSVLVGDLDKSIFSVMEGENINRINKPAKKAVDFLRNDGCDAIILACSELPLLLDQEVNAEDIITPTSLLAEAAVKYAIG